MILLDLLIFLGRLHLLNDFSPLIFWLWLDEFGSIHELNHIFFDSFIEQIYLIQLILLLSLQLLSKCL